MEETASTDAQSLLGDIAGNHRLIVEAGDERSLVDIPPTADPSAFSARLPKGGLPKVPDLKPWGLVFDGARSVVVAGGQPGTQLLYKSETKRLGMLSVAITASPGRDVAPVVVQRADVNMVYWRRDGRAYMLVGTIDKGWLWGLANDIGWQLNAI
jgi:anti-sigma factor RsiW